MKFLCVVCDQQMKLERTVGPDRGSVTLIYACPSCGYPVAMMTNPHETQVVSSLGVSIGSGSDSEDETAAAASKCPFTGVLSSLEDQQPDEMPRSTTGLEWSAGARDRIAKLPDSIRAMAIGGIEQYAKDNGHAEIDEALLDQARGQFGF